MVPAVVPAQFLPVNNKKQKIDTYFIPLTFIDAY